MRRTKAYRAHVGTRVAAASAVGALALAGVALAPSASAAAGCTATYAVTSQWGGGSAPTSS
ncbi:MAG: hypothetical protein NVV70_04430 [Cellulomonas sp.]|nr:hypothetical protein [Cellulomonas sp.]MCR6647411.1 hypothetical protein [Cellulomonas sp.]